MTAKRFETNMRLVIDTEKKYGARVLNAEEVVDLLNEQHEENEQLKQELKTKCIVNKQYEENQRLIKMLDNVANYMQKEHRDMPIDDFVEWWNNIATEGL